MKRLESYFLAAYASHPEGEYARLRLLLHFLVVSSFFAVFYIVDSLFTGFLAARYLMVVTLLFFGFQLISIRSQWIVQLQSQLFVVVSYIIITLLTWVSGGLYSVVAPWFCMIPVVTFLLGSRRSALVWLAICLITLGLLGADWIRPPDAFAFTPPSPIVFYLSLTGGLVGLMYALTSIFDRHQQELLKAIELQNTQLRATEEELRQNLEELSATQDALAKQEAESSSIIRALQDHFIMSEYDLEGRLLRGNIHIEKITGTPVEELIGKARMDYLAEEFKEQFQDTWSKVLRGTSVSQELHFRFPTREFWAKTTLAPIFSTRGDVSRVLGISHEITELKVKQREVIEVNEQMKNTLNSLEKQHELLLQNQQVLSHRQRVLQRYTETLVHLAKSDEMQLGDYDTALRLVLTSGGSAMGVGRLSVWRFDPDNNRIVCEGLHHLDQQRITSGGVLERKDFPRYFDAVLKREIIVANEARYHEATAEFRASYLEPLNIHSMLDVPLFFDGKLYGVLCCEHQHQAIHWLQEDITFGKSLAELITVALSSAKRKESERKIMEQAEYIRSQNNELMTVSEQLRMLNLNLERRVLERTKELENQNARLSEYAYINAHLLRGPLCRILGLLNLMETDGADQDGQLLPLLRRSATELDNVIQKITSLIEAGRDFDRSKINSTIG